ncbi:kinesin-like protein kin-6 [Quercus suber]|uniref:Kinesin-like protein kin-6 n=1 Tax=Quercus suber TaxID=58331 RepID=A0AAW0M5U6_QUESU
MEMKSPPPCPSTVTVRRNPHRKARATPATTATQIPNVPPYSSTATRDIPSFPIHDILAIEVPQNPKPLEDPSPSPPKGPISEDLKVYLRIRPLLLPKPLGRNATVGDQNPRARAKNAWPQNPAKKNAAMDKSAKTKKTDEVCITVNDSHSVTLSPPLALKESKRIKSEVYEGFSHVFSIDSSQGEVYERMVRPLVEDFLRGKSGMLAALGPSGSGKTHTVFGTPREPGMVPLVLQQIFKQSEGSGSKSRSFCISIFEIYSERGKGEKVYDLSAGGTELSMQQSTIKGLQEVAISDAGQAESLIACSMLKRATGMTNANSQSSRSQCIINISSVVNKADEVDNNAVLTIVDLAGAEREKRTGNQSLLEHQKNPKKPLQKHFQNSLILTVKEGAEDYLDTSYLLKQASPYTKIKFNNIEESSMMNGNKRHFQAFSRVGQPKRMKLSGLDAHVSGLSLKHLTDMLTEGSTINRLDASENASTKSDSADLAERERNHQIMENIAKTMWIFLKDYKQKLKVAESEINSLREKLRTEETQNLGLKKELEDLKSCCTCSKGNHGETSIVEVCTSSEPKIGLQGYGSSKIDEKDEDLHSSSLKTSYCNTLEKWDSSPRQERDAFSQVSNTEVKFVNASCLHVENSNQQNCQIGDIFSGNGHNTEDLNDSKYLAIKDNFSDADIPVTSSRISEFGISYSQSHAMVRSDSCSSVELDQYLTEDEESSVLPASTKEDVAFTQGCSTPDVPESELVLDTSCRELNFEKLNRKPLPASSISTRDCSALNVEDQINKPSEFLDLPQSKKDVTSTKESDVDVSITKESDVDVPEIKTRIDTSCKPEKPKRRLLPASSILLRDYSTLDVEDDVEKPKGNRTGGKLAADERKRTQESSLLRLLKSNLRL